MAVAGAGVIAPGSGVSLHVAVFETVFSPVSIGCPCGVFALDKAFLMCSSSSKSSWG